MNIWALCTLSQLLNSALQYKGSYHQYRDKWGSDKTLFMKTDHPSAFGCRLFSVDPWSFPAQVHSSCAHTFAHPTLILHFCISLLGLPGGAVVKNLPASAGDRDLGSVPELGGSPGGGNGNPLQYSCLNYSMAEELSRLVCGVTKSQTRPSNWAAHMCFLVAVLQNSLLLKRFIYWVLHGDSCVVKLLRVS